MSMELSEAFAALRAKYPDDESLQQIEADQERVSQLLKLKEYAAQSETQKLIALCRHDIVHARLRLATDRHLDEADRAGWWAIVDARQWFLQMVVKDYDSEIATIEQDLKAELERM